MDVYVEPHLNWRILGPDDTTQLDDFRGQLDALDHSVLTGVAASITDGDLLVVTAVGGFDAYESLSAYGVVYLENEDPLRMYLMGGIHPTHRHLHIGTALLSWQVAQATAWRDEHRPGRPLWLGCYAELGRPGLERVAARIGFRPERYSYDLQRHLDAPVVAAAVDGIDLEPFTAERCEEVRLLHNLCFEGVGTEVGPDLWAARLAGPDFRPEWSFLATDGGRVVGYAMSGIAEGDDEGSRVGWIERFGVHPDYRGRHIAPAVMARCLDEMRRSGCSEAGVGIDTTDDRGTKGLASGLGWTTRDAVALLTKVVP